MPPAHDELPPCVGCGSCCRLVVELAATDDVPPEMVADHAGVRFMDQQGDGACVALDRRTKSCTIYERRPQICRDFRRGEALCRKTAAGFFGHFSTLPVPTA